MRSEERRNGAGDLVLNRKHVLNLPVVALGPAVGAGHGVGELHRDADAVATTANAALQDVAHAKLPRYLAHVGRLPLVLEGRVAGDDEQVGEPRQLGYDVVGDAVAEIVLLPVAADVFERKD